MLEARSYRRALGEVAFQPPLDANDVSSGRGGRLHLDANEGCDYAIELRFPKKCVTDENRDKWVEASTLLEEKVDHFVDATIKEGKGMGRLCSPIVMVEFEPGVQLGGDYEISLPHSFCETSKSTLEGEISPLRKEQLVVAMAKLEEGVLHPTSPSFHTPAHQHLNPPHRHRTLFPLLALLRTRNSHVSPSQASHNSPYNHPMTLLAIPQPSLQASSPLPTSIPNPSPHHERPLLSPGPHQTLLTQAAAILHRSLFNSSAPRSGQPPPPFLPKVWNALPEDQFELIPAAEAPLGIPAVRLTAKSGGVVGVFSLAHTETDQRVQCLAFTKEIIMPLEPEEMAICIAPDLPNVIEEVRRSP